MNDLKKLIERNFLGGALGPVIVYERDGELYVRSKPSKVRNPQTPNQQRNRRKMGQLSRLSSELKPWIRHLMPSKKFKTARGAFLSQNMHKAFRVREEDQEPVLDLSRLVVIGNARKINLYEGRLQVGLEEIDKAANLVYSWEVDEGSSVLSIPPDASVHTLTIDRRTLKPWYRLRAATYGSGRAELLLRKGTALDDLHHWLVFENEGKQQVWVWRGSC